MCEILRNGVVHQQARVNHLLTRPASHALPELGGDVLHLITHVIEVIGHFAGVIHVHGDVAIGQVVRGVQTHRNHVVVVVGRRRLEGTPVINDVEVGVLHDDRQGDVVVFDLGRNAIKPRVVTLCKINEVTNEHLVIANLVRAGVVNT